MVSPSGIIDIAMTAALRPEIVARTLTSLSKNLRWSLGFRLIVDVAPVGEKGVTQNDVLEKIMMTWDTNCGLTCRALEESLQAEALQWTWSKSDSRFMLQWEDDWELVQPVDLGEMVSIMERNREIGMLYLDRAGKSILDYPKYKGSFLYMEPVVWKRVLGKSLGGPPALLRHEYVKEVLEILDGVTCLDLLSRQPHAQALLKRWTVAVYTGSDGKGNLVKDIGKEWKEQQGIRMKKDTPRGVTWIRQEKKNAHHTRSTINGAIGSLLEMGKQPESL